ncbi:Pepco domain-containing protein [Streptomyces mirabilis]|uniref:Pepco domain-containing protein n=1 Tax=Streptomyces mirabilis TaxID=68239 RepID=UPI003682B87D
MSQQIDKPKPGELQTEVAKSPDVIRVLGLEDGDDRSLFRRPQEWRVGRVEIPIDVFEHRVTGFLDSMRSMIAGLPMNFGEFRLNEVAISAEVSAKGQISLLGSGGELAGSSSLTFTFTRGIPG